MFSSAPSKVPSCPAARRLWPWCAILYDCQDSSDRRYSPMILTSTRFRRRPSNSRVSHPADTRSAPTCQNPDSRWLRRPPPHGPSPVAAMAFTPFCPTKNAPLLIFSSNRKPDSVDTSPIFGIITILFIYNTAPIALCQSLLRFSILPT
jgi:hypothetical protein